MVAARRPRPRAHSAKERSTTAHSDSGDDDGGEESARRRQLLSARQSSASLSKSPAKAAHGIGGRGDDDDFFNRSRRVPTAKRAKTSSFNRASQSRQSEQPHSSKERQAVLDKVPKGADEALGQAFGDGNLSDDEEGNAVIPPSSSDVEVDEEEDDDDEEEAARRRKRQNRSMLQAYKGSMARYEAGDGRARSQSHPYQEREDNAGSSSDRPHNEMAHNRLYRSQKDREEEEEDEGHFRPDRTDKHVTEQIRQVIQNSMPQRKKADLSDDEEQDAEQAAAFDEDLLSLMSGQRATTLRQKLPTFSSSEPRRQSEKVNASRSPVKGRGDAAAPLELSDSEAESLREARSSGVIQSDRSSPVPEIVSINFGASQTSAHVASSTHQPDCAEKSLSHDHHAQDPEPEAQEDHVERIRIVVKGGEQGSLVSLVQVRPTTTVSKLLDHFLTLHQNKVSPAQRNKAIMRFDGDVLQMSSTMQDIGIEDEEQLDVIW